MNKLFDLGMALAITLVIMGIIASLVFFLMWIDSFGHGLGILVFAGAFAFAMVVWFVYSLVREGRDD